MEIPIGSKAWFPAYGHEVPKQVREQLDEIMQKSNGKYAAVKSAGGKCYSCFVKEGRKYYGIA